MIGPLIGIGGVFLILVFAELLWYQRIFTGEVARKFIHMLVGIYVAFWPIIMSLRDIQYICVAFLAVLLISKELKLLKAMHNVERKTWGDILFALGIGITAYLVYATNLSGWVFTVAVLHLACADALAAIIGRQVKHNRTYLVLKKHKKSVVGSLVFWGVSVLLIGAFIILFKPSTPFYAGLTIVIAPLVLTALENFAVYGADNLVVPLAVVLFLS